MQVTAACLGQEVMERIDKLARKIASTYSELRPLLLEQSLALSCRVQLHAWFITVVRCGQFDSVHEAADSAALAVSLRPPGEGWRNLDWVTPLFCLEHDIRVDLAYSSSVVDLMKSNLLSESPLKHWKMRRSDWHIHLTFSSGHPYQTISSNAPMLRLVLTVFSCFASSMRTEELIVLQTLSIVKKTLRSERKL